MKKAARMGTTCKKTVEGLVFAQDSLSDKRVEGIGQEEMKKQKEGGAPQVLREKRIKYQKTTAAAKGKVGRQKKGWKGFRIANRQKGGKIKCGGSSKTQSNTDGSGISQVRSIGWWVGRSG